MINVPKLKRTCCCIIETVSNNMASALKHSVNTTMSSPWKNVASQSFQPREEWPADQTFEWIIIFINMNWVVGRCCVDCGIDIIIWLLFRISILCGQEVVIYRMVVVEWFTHYFWCWWKSGRRVAGHGVVSKMKWHQGWQHLASIQWSCMDPYQQL